jgi:peptide/nickel transport system ATP-binding protein
MSRKQARARVLEFLKEVGIPSPETKIDAYPQLGGQQQRVMIAMAIAVNRNY